MITNKIKGIPKEDMEFLKWYLDKPFGALGFTTIKGEWIPAKAGRLINKYFWMSSIDGMLYPKSQRHLGDKFFKFFGEREELPINYDYGE